MRTRPLWKAGVLALFVSVIATGCAASPDCLEHQAYMDAKSFPALKNPAGLSVPKQADEMKIPEVDGGPVGTYDDVPAGVSSDNPAARCLTTPPPMTARR